MAMKLWLGNWYAGSFRLSSYSIEISKYVQIKYRVSRASIIKSKYGCSVRQDGTTSNYDISRSSDLVLQGYKPCGSGRINHTSVTKHTNILVKHC